MVFSVAYTISRGSTWEIFSAWVVKLSKMPNKIWSELKKFEDCDCMFNSEDSEDSEE